MARFLIEVPHESGTVSCARANKVLLETGSHFLTHADFGCKDGVHRQRLKERGSATEDCDALVQMMIADIPACPENADHIRMANLSAIRCVTAVR